MSRSTQSPMSRFAALMIALPCLAVGCLRLDFRFDLIAGLDAGIANAIDLRQHFAILLVAHSMKDHTEDEILNLAGTECLVGPTFPCDPPAAERAEETYQFIGVADRQIPGDRTKVRRIGDDDFWILLNAVREGVFTGRVESSDLSTRRRVYLAKGQPPGEKFIMMLCIARYCDKSSRQITVEVESVSRVATHNVEIVEVDRSSPFVPIGP